MLSKVYVRLTTGKQEDLNLTNVKFDSSKENNFGLKYKDNFLVPRYQLMSLSDDERNKHEKFLAEMKDSVWKKIM